MGSFSLRYMWNFFPLISFICAVISAAFKTQVNCRNSSIYCTWGSFSERVWWQGLLSCINPCCVPHYFLIFLLISQIWICFVFRWFMHSNSRQLRQLNNNVWLWVEKFPFKLIKIYYFLSQNGVSRTGIYAGLMS